VKVCEDVAAGSMTKPTDALHGHGPVKASCGFVIDPPRLHLTNFHVVKALKSIEVVLGDQSHHAAKFIGGPTSATMSL